MQWHHGGVPEGDTAFLLCRRLRAALAGHVLTGCEFRLPRLATIDLTGAEVVEVVSRGKHLLIRFSTDLTLHTHLRMDGTWTFARTGERRRGGPDHELRVLLKTDRGSALGYRLPVVELVRTDDEDSVVGHLGPDLLGPDWDVGEACRRLLRQPMRSIGESLLDQRNLAGIGTFWRAEILFLQGVHPRTPVAEVADLSRLVHRAHSMISTAAQTGRQATTGDLRPVERAWVFERTRQPCRRCSTPVAFEEFGPAGQERSSYWCPVCQGEAPAQPAVG